MIKTKFVVSTERSARVRNTVFSRVAAFCPNGACSSLARLLLAFSAMAFLFTAPISVAQDSKTPAVLPAPSTGKAIVCIYRVGRFVGSAAHDHLYVNGVYLAYLKNSEYAEMEVDPGTVVVTGLPEMYYAGGVAMSSYAGIKNATKKENERIRLDVEAGKTYYMKWTSGTMATGIKVTLVDPAVGAKEMSKLHLAKPVEQPNDKKDDKKKEETKPETKDTDKPKAN